MKKLPELLSPAGSLQAFEAAIDGGADAIYVGGASFNARINAKNFTADELRDAVKLAHMYGVKVYQTVNIMIHGREVDELISEAVRSAEMGVDAFIVSDLGAASILHRILPEMPLHGSTQMSVHNSAGARLLSDMGITRVVPARELSHKDIAAMVANSPIEVEMFIHGAMCVSHSGQCLFSSLVGGRSGNRGLCAQPCRLPYANAESRVGDKYPLSLKDMSLATHVREIIDSGVASLKIEGRMKSPEYVRGVTKIWRNLLDEGRDATVEDIRALSELFSRGGFSDGYYTSAINSRMLGIRSEDDKQASREVERFTKIQRKVPIFMSVSLTEGKPAKLAARRKDACAVVYGEMPQAAINAPIDEATVRKCMSKLGDTCFCLEELDVNINGRIMMPISQLNALRRDGIAALEKQMIAESSVHAVPYEKKTPKNGVLVRNVGRFMSYEQVTDKAREFFDIILLPLDKYTHDAHGFVMPAVLFDSETERVGQLLEKAARFGARYAVVSNLGQIELIKKYIPDIRLIADYRFNIANDESMCFFEDRGFESAVLSTELTLPQIRDIGGAKAAIVYGRIPLMTLVKCVIMELYGDKAPKGQGKACEICVKGEAKMKDRRGFIFPVVREMRHRNIVLNSLPTYMSDKQDELMRADITDRHFLFTVENACEVDDVIDSYIYGCTPEINVRRIQ